jgi:hypothetical protein
MNTGDLLSLAAVLVSVYAVYTTSKFNSRQKALLENQDRLNKILLEKETEEISDSQKADVSANLVRYGQTKYRIKIFNKGKSPARNVRVSFPDGSDLVIPADIDEKFPLEILEPHQAVELIAAVCLGSKGKYQVDLSWTDGSDQNREKTTYVTV